MSAIPVILLVAAISSVAVGCQGVCAGRSSSGLAAARNALGLEATTKFRENEKAKAIQFYSRGSFFGGDHFPGLRQEEVNLWIEQRGMSWTRIFNDEFAPVFDDSGFTPEDYWNAVDEFLAAYNRLVLDHLMAEHIQPLVPTPGSVTPPSDAPKSGAARL